MLRDDLMGRIKKGEEKFLAFFIPPRGLEPLADNSQAFEKKELIDFLKRCAATGDAKKIENEAIFDRLADVWDTLGQRVQNQILDLAGIDLEKPTGKQ